MRSQNPYRRKIDGRTPAARERNLSGASFDLAGNVTGGKDAATGASVAYPARPRRDIYRTAPQAPAATVPTAQLPSRKAMLTAPPAPSFAPTQFRKPTLAPMMGDALGDSSKAQAATAAMRQAQTVRDGAAVGAARSAWREGIRAAAKESQPSGAQVARTGFVDAPNVAVAGKYGRGYSTHGSPASVETQAIAARAGMPVIAPRASVTDQARRATPSLDNATVGSGVTGIMDGYRNAMKQPNLQVQGPKLDIAAADPLKRKRAAMKTY